MSIFISILLVGGLVVATVSVIALIYAIADAEEGYEDAEGFHSESPTGKLGDSAPPTVDTGNPWDQVEGACCPLNLGPPFRTLSQDQSSEV